MPRAWREPERIGDAVRRQLARFGAPTRIGGIVHGWPSAVGGLVARNAWPARVQRDGTLVVLALALAPVVPAVQTPSRQARR